MVKTLRYSRIMGQKDANRMTKIVDHDQTAPLGCTMFAHVCLSENLGTLHSIFECMAGRDKCIMERGQVDFITFARNDANFAVRRITENHTFTENHLENHIYRVIIPS